MVVVVPGRRVRRCCAGGTVQGRKVGEAGFQLQLLPWRPSEAVLVKGIINGHTHTHMDGWMDGWMALPRER